MLIWAHVNEPLEAVNVPGGDRLWDRQRLCDADGDAHLVQGKIGIGGDDRAGRKVDALAIGTRSRPPCP